jgi:23S rRNA (guanosine2251-2'-O)-methyltransferase
MTGWIWGRHPVLEAIRAGRARRVLLAAGRRHSDVLDEIRRAALDRAVPLEEVPLGVVAKVAEGENSQGVAAEVSAPETARLADVLATLPDFLLVLDQVQDPHNVGALMRTADAAGVAAVVVPERRSAALSGVVAKTSAGATNYLPAVSVPNLSRAMDEMRQAGLWTVGLDGEARQSLYEIDLTVPVALVLGGEGKGLRRLTRHHCDLLARLPMNGRVESLNASVAGSIAMYEVVRQRLAGRGGA